MEHNFSIIKRQNLPQILYHAQTALKVASGERAKKNPDNLCPLLGPRNGTQHFGWRELDHYRFGVSYIRIPRVYLECSCVLISDWTAKANTLIHMLICHKTSKLSFYGRIFATKPEVISVEHICAKLQAGRLWNNSNTEPQTKSKREQGYFILLLFLIGSISFMEVKKERILTFAISSVKNGLIRVAWQNRARIGNTGSKKNWLASWEWKGTSSTTRQMNKS